MMGIMALDVGTKTIGVATGLMDSRLPKPLLTLKRVSVKKDVIKLVKLCMKQEIRHVVVGLPLHLDGTEGRSARLARQIGEGLRQAAELSIHYQDERFSTIFAEETLRKLGKSANKRKRIIDQAAAAIILKSWFDDQPT